MRSLWSLVYGHRRVGTKAGKATPCCRRLEEDWAALFMSAIQVPTAYRKPSARRISLKSRFWTHQNMNDKMMKSKAASDQLEVRRKGCQVALAPGPSPTEPLQDLT